MEKPCRGYQFTLLRNYNASLLDCNDDATSPPAELAIKGENFHSDLGGRMINISVLARPDARFDSEVTINPAGKVTLLPSIALTLLHTLQIAMNFTPNLKMSDHWGLYHPETSQWSGMIASLINKETEFTIATAAVLPVRRTVVDFNIDLYAPKFIGIYKTPNQDYDEFACLKPFRIHLWLATAITATAMTFTLYVLSSAYQPGARSVSSSSVTGSHCYGYTDSTAFSTNFDCIFWPLNALCSKGIYHIPMPSSFRIALLSGSVLGVVLNAAYSGTLISFLSVSSKSYGSLREILMYTTWTFDCKPFIQFQMLKESTSPLVAEALQRMPRAPLYEDVALAKPLLLGGSYVFLVLDIHAYDPLTNNFTVEEQCSISHIPVPAEEARLATMVRKKSELKRIIDYHIIKMKMTGLNRCWLHRYLPKKPFCSEGSSAGSGIPLQRVLISIWIVAAGILLSVVALLLEKCVSMLTESNISAAKFY